MRDFNFSNHVETINSQDKASLEPKTESATMNNERMRVGAGECLVTYEPVKTASGLDASVNEGHGQSDEKSSSVPLHEDDVDDSSGSGSGESGNGGSGASNGEKVKKGPKKDRSKLRKGKWTVEEEEYTSRIIHYFSTGLLSLPEGATLRSYLAEKLNCDPMRITKKYAGASCLGRRVYNFRDRPHPTIAEIQLAKAELDLLEQRFRKRIEDGHSSMPLPSPTLIANFVQSTIPALANGNAFNPWLSALSAASNNGLSAQAAPPAGVLASNWAHAPAPAPLPWLLPNPQATAPAPAPVSSVPSNNTTLQFNTQGFESMMKSIAFAQAAASLAPAVSQLAVANFQRNQQQLAQETQAELIAGRLRQVYEEQFMKAQSVPNPQIVPSTKLPTILPTPAPIKSAEIAPQQPAKAAVPSEQLIKNEEPTIVSNPKPRTEEDQAAGSILLGFLSSLRQSYEEALQEKHNSQQKEEEARNTKTDSDSSDSFSGVPTRLASATVTDFSSPPTESPVEDSDWNSDKKTDPSSSEDSDKESSKGPPRKRLKKMAAECMKHLGSR